MLFCLNVFTAFLSICAQADLVDMDVVFMIEQNDVDSFRRELQMNLNPNSQLDDVSLLMIAAQLGRVEIVKHLLSDNRINIHAQDEQGNTALHMATMYEQVEVVKLLLYVDRPQICRHNKQIAPLLYQMQNREGKTAADIAHGLKMFEMLENPDAYIKKYSHEFGEIAAWYAEACPVQAAARLKRLETIGEKIHRNYQQVKKTTKHAANRMNNAFKSAYEKTKQTAEKSYNASLDAKNNIEARYDGARNFVNTQYEHAQKYAQKGYEKTKDAASKSIEKLKNSCKWLFDRMKGR